MAAFRSASSASFTNTSAPSVAEPTGAAVGDWIVVIVHGNGQITITDNNGSTPFTKAPNFSDYKPNPTNGHTITVFYRRKESGDPTTYNFTMSASGRAAVDAIAFSGTLPGFDVAPDTANAANEDSAADGDVTVPGITVANNSVHVVFCGWDTSAIGTITTPTGYTLAANANGGGEPLHTSYKNFATGGSTGSVVCQNTEFGAKIAGSFSIKELGTAYSSTLTETVTIVDTINKQTSRIFSEVATIVDTIIKTTSRAVVETVTIVDTLIKQAGKVLIDAVTVVGSLFSSFPYIIGANSNSGSSTTPSVTMPEALPGDLLMVIVSNNNANCADNNGAQATTEDGDYTGFSGGNAMAVYSRVVTGEEPSTLNYTLASSQRWAIIAFIVRNWNGTTIYDVSPSGGVSSGGTPSHIDCASATIGVNNALAIAVANIDGNANGSFNNPSSPSGWNDVKIENGQQPVVVGFKRVQAGATGVVSMTCTTTGGAGAGLNVFSIRPMSGTITSTITEAITIVDTVLKSTSRALSETVIIVDSIVRTYFRAFSETATIVDNVKKMCSRVISESVTIVDSIVRSTTRILGEVITIVDTRIRGVFKTIKEKVHIIDYKESKTVVSDFETPSAGNLVAPTGGVLFGSDGTYKGVANDFAKSGAQSFKISASSEIDGGVYFMLSGMKVGAKIAVSAYIKTDENVVNAAITLDTAQHGIGGSNQKIVRVGANNDGYVLNRDFTCDKTQINIFLGLGIFGADSQGTVWYDEVVLYVEGQAFSLSRALAEGITTVDSIQKYIARVVQEVSIVGDFLGRLFRQEATEAITATDSLLREMAATISEAILVVDEIAKQIIGKMRKAITVLFSKTKKTVIVLKGRRSAILKNKEDKTVVQ